MCWGTILVVVAYSAPQRDEVIVQLSEDFDITPILGEHAWRDVLAWGDPKFRNRVSYIFEYNYRIRGHPGNRMSRLHAFQGQVFVDRTNETHQMAGKKNGQLAVTLIIPDSSLSSSRILGRIGRLPGARTARTSPCHFPGPGRARLHHHL